MSLIRQVALLLLATLLLAFVGGVAVNIDSTRAVLETQVRLKNSDNAGTLALALSQQKGDVDRMRILMAAQFDAGFYQRIRLTAADGQALFDAHSEPMAGIAPAWFVDLLPIPATPGVAQVSDGWRAIGSLEVESQTAFVHDELWRGSQRAAEMLALIGLLAGALGALFVARLRRPLERTVEQARAIERGEYVTLSEPRVPELRRLTRAMNAMVARLKRVFESQAAQVEALREQANHDRLTGLSNRPHFMGKLGAVLDPEEGSPACGLVLLRVLSLADINHKLGRDATDRMLQVIAQTLQTYAQHVPGCFIGRLNGSDFALCLPVAGVAFETAQAAIELLRALLPAVGGSVFVAAGVGEGRRGASLSALMGTTDLALARAENTGAFAVEAAVGVATGSGASAAEAFAARGEVAWRDQLRSALVEGRARLGSFPVLDAQARLVHIECPLRLQFDASGAYEVAAVWLPLALRARLTPMADERALALALAETRRDGQPRCVNLSPASLADSGFAARLRNRLLDSPDAASGLWLEVAETAAADHFELLRELGRQLRPTGARFGLEHAGERLGRLERLFELGLDYVKLDAAVTASVAGDADRCGFVSGIVVMLHGLSVKVYAEGVARADDAAALWDCGVDGMTGPWVSANPSGAPA